MKYEYKSIVLNDNGSYLRVDKNKIINAEFEAGWEYVDHIQQSGYEYSAVFVILRRKKRREDFFEQS
jgi:hypothetical protein